MMTLSGFLRRRLFGIHARETEFARRGFRGGTTGLQSRIEQIGRVFLDGYHAALVCGEPELLSKKLENMDIELRGFAFEGAAMGFALLDGLTPWSGTRIQRLLAGAGDAHAYMIHVGTGWLGARMPRLFRRILPRLDPMLRWLAFDGWGFHEGYFHWPKYISGQHQPERLAGYEQRAFDQGLGRSFWFVNGGNAELIAQTISGFSADRRPDLWSGVGLAAVYAGMADEDSLQRLCRLSHPFRPQLAQGAAFAAKARQRAGNSTDYVRAATSLICDMTADDAARLCDGTLENLPADAQPPAYEIWRRRIQNHFASSLLAQTSL